MRRNVLFSFLILVLTVSGCATAGAFNTGHLTDVQLAEPNFEVVATDVQGEASAGYIFGASGTFYRQMQTVALARISGSGMLYQEAIADLWDSFRADYGEVEGRDLALVNVRYDTEALNVLVYTKPTVSVRADVVEFTE